MAVDGGARDGVRQFCDSRLNGPLRPGADTAAYRMPIDRPRRPKPSHLNVNWNESLCMH